MAKQGDVHVVWNTEIRRWRVEVTGNERASGRYETKQDAIRSGRTMARRNSSELVIHKRDGTIEERDSHGNDPSPPRG